MGSDITYSGTVSAAMEGVVSGVPAIAVSLADYWSGTLRTPRRLRLDWRGASCARGSKVTSC